MNYLKVSEILTTDILNQEKVILIFKVTINTFLAYYSLQEFD